MTYVNDRHTYVLPIIYQIIIFKIQLKFIWKNAETSASSDVSHCICRLWTLSKLAHITTLHMLSFKLLIAFSLSTLQFHNIIFFKSFLNDAILR